MLVTVYRGLHLVSRKTTRIGDTILYLMKFILFWLHSTTLNTVISVANSVWSCSIRIVNCPCSVANTRCMPIHYMSNLVDHFGHHKFTMLSRMSLIEWIFHPNLNHPWQYWITNMLGCKTYQVGWHSWQAYSCETLFSVTNSNCLAQHSL